MLYHILFNISVGGYAVTYAKYLIIFLYTENETGNHIGLPLRSQMIHNIHIRRGAPMWAPENVSHMAKRMTARRYHITYTDITQCIRHLMRADAIRPYGIKRYIYTPSVGADIICPKILGFNDTFGKSLFHRRCGDNCRWQSPIANRGESREGRRNMGFGQ